MLRSYEEWVAEVWVMVGVSEGMDNGLVCNGQSNQVKNRFSTFGCSLVPYRASVALSMPVMLNVK